MANDIRLDHPTVSQTHCEIEVGPSGIVLRDLDSTNGTFVDGQRIQEAVLNGRHSVRLGELDLELTDSVAGRTAADSALHDDPNAALPSPTINPYACANHPRTRATWFCTECERQLCGGCVKSVKLDIKRTVTLCRICDGLCERLEKSRNRAKVDGFFTGLIRALAYPLQPAGLFLLIAAAAVSLLVSVSGRWVLLGGFSFILGIAVGGFVLTFLRQIILSSAEGEDALPDWPELDLQSLRETVLLYFLIGFVCFGPWTLCSLYARPESEGAKLACHALLGLGALYFPMAVLAVVISDDAAAMNPLLICVSIMRTAGRYVTMCVFLGVIVGAGFLAESALTSAGMPRAAAGVNTFLSFYAALVTARAIGWFYFANKDTLGW